MKLKVGDPVIVIYEKNGYRPLGLDFIHSIEKTDTSCPNIMLRGRGWSYGKENSAWIGSRRLSTFTPATNLAKLLWIGDCDGL